MCTYTFICIYVYVYRDLYINIYRYIKTNICVVLASTVFENCLVIVLAFVIFDLPSEAKK